MKINTIIFDLDGTLLSTLDDIKDSTNFALRKCGFPERSLEEVNSFVGHGTNYLIGKAVPQDTPSHKIDECNKIYRQHYKGNKDNKTAPYNGIMDILEKMHNKNYKLAIVSNKFDSAVKELGEKYFSEYMDVAIGESSAIKRKPAPDSIYAAMEELGSSKEETIYVGDSEVDVMAAHNAGLPCIGVSWGFRGRQVLKDEGADYIIDTPDEIFDILDNY